MYAESRGLENFLRWSILDAHVVFMNRTEELIRVALTLRRLALETEGLLAGRKARLLRDAEADVRAVLKMERNAAG